MERGAAHYDGLQLRLCNWLEVPTTLHPTEVESLINNITFFLRRLQSKSIKDPTAYPAFNFAVVPDDDVSIVTGSVDDGEGFIMSVYFGQRQVIVGQLSRHRETAMNGLRKSCEKLIGSLILEDAEDEEALRDAMHQSDEHFTGGTPANPNGAGSASAAVNGNSNPTHPRNYGGSSNIHSAGH